MASRGTQRWGLIVTSFVLLAMVSGPLAAQAIPDEPAARSRRARETETALTKLRSDVAELKSGLAAGQREESAVVAALSDAERAVSQHQAALVAIAERSAGHQSELTRIADEQARVQAQIDSQRQALAALLRLTYARSRQAPAKLLLDPQRAPRLARALGYGRVLQRSRLDGIAQFAAHLAELAGLAQAQSQALAALAAERSAAEAEQQALAIAVAEREATLTTLRGQLADQRQRLRVLGRDERALLRLLEQLRDIFADLPKTLEGAQPFRSLRGRLPWPVAGPASASDNGGLLIAARAGAAVQAIAHGRVAFADWLKGYGLLLILDHGDGYMSLYGHNEALLKAEGSWVQAGETIASVGRSGGESQAALHFELRERGRSIDPKPWLRRR